MKSATSQSLGSMYRKLTPCGTGLTPQEIVSNQRARIYAAMIETVAERGYSASSIDLLRVRAGVSMAAIYREFHSKNGCFLATFDVIAARAISRVRAAYSVEQDWTLQLRAAFAAFAAEVMDQPKAARLALIEALGAGPAALRHMERASQAFEAMIQTSFKKAPDEVDVPPLIIRGIVGGISRVTRQLLLDRREDELPAFADTLVEWALTYRSTAAARLPAVAPRFGATHAPAGLATPGNLDTRARILRSAAWVASERGFSNGSVAQIVQEAGVPDASFFEHFKTKEDCFLAAYDEMGAEVLAYAAATAREGTDWPDSIHRGTRALMHRVAADPVFARCAFIEVFAVGPKGIDRRSRLMDSFTALLMSQAPHDQRPSEIVAEAIVGAVWQVAHGYIAHDHTHALADVADHASYLVLAPIIGADSAIERILKSRKGVQSKRTRPLPCTVLPSTRR